MKYILQWLRKNLHETIRQVLFLLIAFGTVTLIITITGYEPFAVFKGLWRGITSDIGGTVRWTTPLVICGLAIAVTFRAGVFNLGVDGQLMLSASVVAGVALFLSGHLPPIFVILLSIISAMIVGALWALLPGFLLTKWGTNEVVSTLLLNYVAIYFTDYLVSGPMQESSGLMNTTDKLAEDLWFPIIIPSSSANIGFYIAIVLAVVLAYIFFSTTLGYELKSVGKNPIFAKYGGIRSKRVILLSFGLSGALAGLAGAIEVFGVLYRFPARFGYGLGFDGVVVSLLAQNNPIAIIFSGAFLGALRNGAMNMERITDVPKAMVDIFQSIVILMVTARLTLDYFRRKNKLRNSIEKILPKNLFCKIAGKPK